MFKRNNRIKGKKSKTKDLGEVAKEASTTINESNKNPKKIKAEDKEIENSALKKILDHLQNDLQK